MTKNAARNRVVMVFQQQMEFRETGVKQSAAVDVYWWELKPLSMVSSQPPGSIHKFYRSLNYLSPVNPFHIVFERDLNH